MVIRIFVNRAYHKYTWGYNFPIRTTPKKNFVSAQVVIFQGSPLFLAVLGLCHCRGISTLNFGPFSTKLGGTVWAIKKMTQNDYGPGPGRNYGETAVFTFGRKACAQARKQHLDTAIPTDAVSSSNYLEKVF